MSNASSALSKAQRLRFGEKDWLAYHQLPAAADANPDNPGVIFLGGFKSDMTGSKAMYLESLCRDQGLGFVRFDYYGHGESSGAFEKGTIGQWTINTVKIIDELTHGPQILVGSSMGGWIMLLAAIRRPERIAGLLGIAAAPDFTEELIWAQMDEEARHDIAHKGMHLVPNCYEGEESYPITRTLIQDGRDHLLLRGKPIPIDCPVRLIHGMKDADVPWSYAPRLADKLISDDVEVTLVKDGDHRMSSPERLALLNNALAGLLVSP